MSRLTSIQTEVETSPNAVYGYLGAGTIVCENDSEPGVFIRSS